MYEKTTTDRLKKYNLFIDFAFIRWDNLFLRKEIAGSLKIW